MAHNLDMTDGQASFVSARQDAWHQLGTTLPEAMTAADALEFGHLAGWDTRKAPIFAGDPDTGETIAIEDRVAVLRDNPIRPGQVDHLGTVGPNYQIIQNEDHIGFLDTLVDSADARFDTAGAIDGGRKVFVTMEMPDHISVGGDPVGQYLAAINSHDGSTAFTVIVTPIRIVCQNTLNVAMSGARNVYKVRHTAGARAIATEAREILGMSFRYLETFQINADRMIDQTLTQSDFERIITAEFGAHEDAPQASHTRAQNQIDRMLDLFVEAGTQEGIRETAWAGFNALTEYADHFIPVRGDNREDRRAAKAILDPAFKQRALDLFLPA